MSSVLTVSLAKELTGKENLDDIKRVVASKRKLTHISDLRSISHLQRLDLSHNELIELQGLAASRSLTWLNVSHNSLTSLNGVQSLSNLIVLNASNNSLTKTGDLSSLLNLKALVLNNNSLSVIDGLEYLRNLNTLVLSHNQFEMIDISQLTQLTKLSITNNRLTSVPDTKNNVLLLELRLTSNQITKLPNTLQVNTRLQIIDMGHNQISVLRFIEVLKCLVNLKNLNLKGNPLVDYKEVLDWLPRLHVLDGTKLGKADKRQPLIGDNMGKADDDDITALPLEKKRKVELPEDENHETERIKPSSVKRKESSGVVMIETYRKTKERATDPFNNQDTLIKSWEN
jgi:Leucine-rich repeat (LRR) protein